ncbi:MAG: phosphatidylglycerol lysyltransferase domain-containing protein, partial [Jatrophihabitantaceae bacterium]
MPRGTALPAAQQVRAPHRSGPPSRWRRIRAAYLAQAPRIVTWIAWILGVLVLTDAFWVRERGRVHALTRIIPVPATAAATAVTAVSGLLLLRLAAGLRKRKRLEWLAAVAVTLVLSAAHIFRDERRPIEAAITLVLLLALLAARSRFTAKPDPRSRWFAARVFAQFIAVAVAFGMVLLYAYPRHVVGHPPFWTRLGDVLVSLIGAGGTVTVRGERFADIYRGTLLGFGLVTIVVVVLLVLRPSQPVSQLSDEDDGRLRALLAANGERDSLGYFALRRDKAVVFSPSGKAAVAYRVVAGVSLASGDPLGDPEAWPGAIDAWLTEA